MQSMCKVRILLWIHRTACIFGSLEYHIISSKEAALFERLVSSVRVRLSIAHLIITNNWSNVLTSQFPTNPTRMALIRNHELLLHRLLNVEQAPVPNNLWQWRMTVELRFYKPRVHKVLISIQINRNFITSIYTNRNFITSMYTNRKYISWWRFICVGFSVIYNTI